MNMKISFYLLVAVLLVLCCIVDCQDERRGRKDRRHRNRQHGMGEEIHVHDGEGHEGHGHGDHHHGSHHHHRSHGDGSMESHDHHDSHEENYHHLMGEDHHHGDHVDHHHPHKTYLFQIGNNFGPYEYLDIDGTLKGFYIDLIKAVCKEADHYCDAMYDEASHCWVSDTMAMKESPGIGLMSGFYDACMGYTQSPDRQNSVAFSHPFTPNPEARLYMVEEYAKCEPIDIKGLTIGFISGWSVNRLCLGRQFNITGHHDDYDARVYHSNEDMLTAVKNGEIDAIFSVPQLVPRAMNLKPVCGTSFQCTRAGISVMARKDSPLISWWNGAFDRIKTNGKFRELCQEARQKHGHRGRVVCA